MTRSRGLLAILATAATLACGGGTTDRPDPGRDVPPDIPLKEVVWLDTGTDRGPADPGMDAEMNGGDPGPDGGDLPGAGETRDPGADAPGGLTECQAPGDCPSGFCVLAGDGRRYCAPSCLGGSCPDGWRCAQVTGTGSDTVILCLPALDYLCRPCTRHDDCRPPGIQTGDLCVPWGAEGSWCGRDCSLDPGSCPAGFQCAAVGDRGNLRQCRPVAGLCPCSAEASLAGDSTACWVENAHGRCTGSRRCTAGGLGPCDARTPAPETCNGQDDDCNGQADDNLPVEPCERTDGVRTCPGTMRCPDGQPVCDAREPAPERCDGVDNDCNGVTDDEGASGCLKFYRDDDDDSWGAEEGGRCLCTASAPFSVTVKGDCDDTLATVHPGAAERCNGLDDDCNGAVDDAATDCTEFWRDGDNDGYGVAGDARCLCAPAGEYRARTSGDCNDFQAAVHPGAPEACNGADDDCNGVTDDEGADGCTPLYRDLDGDRWGDPLSVRCLCGVQEPWTALQGGDCNDKAPGVFPGARESCNGLDDDCDNATDEPGAADCTTYLVDADGDDLAAPGAPSACLCAPEGVFRATKEGDCDDRDPTVRPGATESCFNGVDDDCDGATDEEGASACTFFLKDDDGDGWGLAEDRRCLCAATGPYRAVQAGDCDDAEPGTWPGAPETCDGADNDCDGATDEPDATGCVRYLRDGDGDGWGLPDDGRCLCAPGAPYATTLGPDCDDADPARSPGLVEACNGIDDDCDGTVDEEDATGCLPRFRDGDEDGWGTGPAHCLCAPEGQDTALAAGDCDDADALRNPGTAETCNNVDDDCDGAVDQGLSQACASPCGIGTETCEAGTWIGCTAMQPMTCLDHATCTDAAMCVTVCPAAPPETCNDVDDDCDGTTDEEFDCRIGAADGRACGNCGTQGRTCGSECAWGDWTTCSGEGACAPGTGDQEACGNCGLRRRTCDDACAWGDWGLCEGAGECAPGTPATQPCGNCGVAARECGADCAWPAWGNCLGEGACAPGTPATQACGNCGTQGRSCGLDCQWPEWGACAGEGACRPGDVQTEPCGNCGSRTRTCGEDCQWGDWSGCGGEGVCAPGTQKSQGCGNCGTQVATCNSSCQWDAWGACGGEGVCAPGSQKTQGCGNCGIQSATCNATCQWDAWGACGGQGECAAGAQQSQGCGRCGVQYRSCGSNCYWGAWGACQGEGPCWPGATQQGSCDRCSQQVCQSNCQWGGCGLKGGSQCEWWNGTHWRCCGSGGWQYCLSTCVWSTQCSYCNGYPSYCGCP